MDKKHYTCKCGNSITTNKAVVKCAKCGELLVDFYELEVYALNLKQEIMRSINLSRHGNITPTRLIEKINNEFNLFKMFVEGVE